MEKVKYKSTREQDLSSTIFSLIVALTISLINVIMTVIIKLLAKKFIKSYSITQEEIFITKKLWKIQFVNMAIIPLLMSASTLNFLSQGGLTEELFLIFAVNSVVPHVVAIFGDAGVYQKLGMNWLLKRFINRAKRYKKNTSDKEAIKDMIRLPIFTQKEANEIVLGLDYNISGNYAYVLSSMGLSMFYFSIFPLGIMFCVLGLVLMYWVSKYVVVYRCHKLKRFSQEISLSLLSELELCVVFYSVSPPRFLLFLTPPD